VTAVDVLNRVTELRALLGHDKEAACSGAEQLRCEVLKAIADGPRNPATLAQAAIGTIEEDFGGC
jgi:hypothetical protein